MPLLIVGDVLERQIGSFRACLLASMGDLQLIVDDEADVIDDRPHGAALALLLAEVEVDVDAPGTSSGDCRRRRTARRRQKCFGLTGGHRMCGS